MPYLLLAKIGGGIALVIAAVIAFKMFVSGIRSDERQKVTAEFTVAEQKATIADLEGALREAKNRQKQTEQSNADLNQQMAGVVAGRDAYANRLLAAVRRGTTQGSGQTGVADPAGVFSEADQKTLVDDIGICTENTVRLQNAADWYERQRTLKVDEETAIP